VSGFLPSLVLPPQVTGTIDFFLSPFVLSPLFAGAVLYALARLERRGAVHGVGRQLARFGLFCGLTLVAVCGLGAGLLSGIHWTRRVVPLSMPLLLAAYLLARQAQRARTEERSASGGEKTPADDALDVASGTTGTLFVLICLALLVYLAAIIAALMRVRS
jgi:hypothetical protein